MVVGARTLERYGGTLIDEVLYAFDGLYGGSESFYAESVRLSAHTKKVMKE